MQYDADEQPDPDAWLELDETERIDLVIEYHRRTGVQLESPEPHAIAHVVVENQVALGEATPGSVIGGGELPTNALIRPTVVCPSTY